jgi:hypothetical protein
VNARSAPLIAFSLMLSVSIAAPAQAEGDGNGERWAKSQGNRIGLEFDVLGTQKTGPGTGIINSGLQISTTTLGMGFTLVGQIKALDKIYADAEIPIAYGKVDTTVSGDLPPSVNANTSATGFVFGNPTLGAHYAGALSDNAAFFAGGTVSIPVIHVGDTQPGESESALTALYMTAVARVYFDTHRLIPDHLPLRPRAGVELRILPMLYYRGDAGLMLAIPTAGGEVEAIIEQGNEFEGRTAIGLGGGLRVQEAFLLTEDDKAQTALEPFLTYETPGAGIFVRLGYLVALDPVLGFGLNQGKVATFRVAAGGKF